VEAQLGYQRLLLAFSLAVLCACFLLPAPGANGQVRLPGSNTTLPTLCMLKRECGIDCPGCGLTRCFLSMSHAQVASAWHYHPAGVLLFAAVAAQIPWRLVQIRRLRRGRRELNHWALSALPWLLVAAILGQWILRMTSILAA
jgi:hypothetical protein